MPMTIKAGEEKHFIHLESVVNEALGELEAGVTPVFCSLSWREQARFDITPEGLKVSIYETRPRGRAIWEGNPLDVRPALYKLGPYVKAIALSLQGKEVGFQSVYTPIFA